MVGEVGKGEMSVEGDTPSEEVLVEDEVAIVDGDGRVVGAYDVAVVVGGREVPCALS